MVTRFVTNEILLLQKIVVWLCKETLRWDDLLEELSKLSCFQSLKKSVKIVQIADVTDWRKQMVQERASQVHRNFMLLRVTELYNFLLG